MANPGSSLSDESIELFTINSESSQPDLSFVNSDPTPYRKRLQTWLLTILRGYIVYVVSALVIYAVIISGILIFKYTANETSIDVVTTLAPFRFTTVSAETVKMSVRKLDKVACQKVNCKTVYLPCQPTGISYLQVKQYSCCSCTEFQLIRFERSRLTQTVNLVVTSDRHDPSTMSALDLEALPDLPGLTGHWDVREESDKAIYLLYSGVGLPIVDYDDSQ